MRKLRLHFAVLSILIYLLIPAIATAQSSDEPVVRAVLFYSPTCPHCHKVITEVLMPMIDDYGDQLQIMGVDITQPEGGQFYQAVIAYYQIPPERQGVPTLIVGDVILVGDGEIPAQFPTMVEEGLAADGIDWPDIPGLSQALSSEAEQEPSPTPVPQATATSLSTSPPQATNTPTLTPTPTPIPVALTIGDAELPAVTTEASSLDPADFTLAGIVLIGMVIALGYTALRLFTTQQRLLWLERNPAAYAESWFIPLLSLVGLAVAIYLAYVEITHVEAACGPVGDCNTVQASPYAQILGIPIAVLGMLNYLAVGLLWAGQKYSEGRIANLSVLGLLGLTIFGTFFSIYLTLLELFVIDAVCAWCLTSAVIATLLMLLVVVPVTGNSSPKRMPPLQERARV